MKKVFIAAAALFVAFGAQAQILSDATKYVKAGIALNRPAGEDAPDDYVKNQIGYDVVVGFQKDFATPGLYWGMEAGLGTRGFKQAYHGDSGTYNLHNVKITPIQIGFKVDFLDSWAVDFHLGAVASYDYTGNYVAVTDGSKTTFKYSKFKDDFHQFDFALNPGITFWYGQFGAEICWFRGFNTWVKTGDEKIYTSDFIIRLAYRF